jgi:hypothetical protein
MTSAPIRDPLADHLITPQNAALLLIDYQPAQVASVRSMDHDLLIKNAVSTVRTIKTFGIPVVHSTVNVASGQGQPTIPELAGLLENDKPLDRTTVNSWEDTEFLEAVRATGRRKLIFCALWTEVCMAFTALDVHSTDHDGAVQRYQLLLGVPPAQEFVIGDRDLTVTVFPGLSVISGTAEALASVGDLRATAFVDSLAEVRAQLAESGWTTEGSLGAAGSLLARDPDGMLTEFVEISGRTAWARQR